MNQPEIRADMLGSSTASPDSRIINYLEINMQFKMFGGLLQARAETIVDNDVLYSLIEKERAGKTAEETEKKRGPYKSYKMRKSIAMKKAWDTRRVKYGPNGGMTTKEERLARNNGGAPTGFPERN